MRFAADLRSARADELSAAFPDARALLAFYRRLVDFQQPIFERFNARGETDVRALLGDFPRLIELAVSAGPAPLALFARERLVDTAARAALLESYWEGDAAARSGEDAAAVFFARALLQPYAESLASRGDIGSPAESAVCPFCGSKPVTAVLRGEGDGGKRSLICGLCATEWLYRRVLCPNCGEEHKDRLPVYIAEGLDYVRVEACDTCKTYLKAVDLTKDGRAVPVVDEIATVSLNIWAEEHGYGKLEANILGM
jgi:FdhE protein